MTDPRTDPAVVPLRPVSDAEAFRILFDTHFDRLLRYVRRYLGSPEESEDLIQDLFLTLWRDRRTIGLHRDLTGYLYAMARHRALDRLKHRRVETRFRERRALALALEREGPSWNPATELEERDLAAAIQRAVDTLPPRQREVLRLRWQEHLSYAEVGAALGIAPKTVAIHRGRALRHLRAMLPGLLQ